jgi:hypothetical protein
MALSFSADSAMGRSPEISPVTRRDIFDFLRTEKGPWWGRLSETGFLGQLYDLDALPHGGPHGDWSGPAAWLQVSGTTVACTIADMLAAIDAHLRQSPGMML